ncbi:transcriptional regulator [Shewanella hanedai]|uniref:Transcriptional regulator n=1 Tax=Shewanella hanedai TaxID=25 RepID=A0A553JM99_SHEHA|nr:transcriptional regulator [Shewanella hanedai]TRY13576.1 transcriptional regulator [Shewanella hanedai]GGI81972.1 transcriptional regulator [Shewanella hanedai]
MSNWVAILAEQASAHGQEGVAKKLGISKAVVSLLINQKYLGDLERMKRLVEGAYMHRMVECPIVGLIPMHLCDRHQSNKSTSNPVRLRLYRACRSGCEHSSLKVKTQFKRIQVTQLDTAIKQYRAEGTYSRLERQSVSDNGGYKQLCELLRQELIALGHRYNRLLETSQYPRSESDETS